MKEKKKIYVYIILSLFTFVLLTGCSENNVKTEENENTTQTSKYLEGLYAGDPERETVYNGTVTTKYRFKSDGTVTWGQCYSATGKCPGLSYTYEKNGLDITIYQDNGDVQYSCYLKSSGKYLYCKHHLDMYNRGYVGYTKVD